MEKVEMIVSGRKALVPVNKAKMIAKKQELVAQAIELRELANTMPASQYNLAVDAIMTKIIRLNRQIGPCVQFLPEVK